MKIIFTILILGILGALIFAGIKVLELRAEGAEFIREADRFNIPVVKNLVSELSSWKYEDLKPHLDDGFLKIFTQKEFQKELDRLSVLGKVKKIKYIRHAGHKRYKNWQYTTCAVNKYSASTDFDNGKGTVVIDLNHCHKNVEVTFFQVHSKAIPIPKTALQ